MAGIDPNRDGVVDMYPEELEGTVGVFSAAATELDTAWMAKLATIIGLAAALGKGSKGVAFKADYDQYATGVTDWTSDVPSKYRAFTEAGASGVRIYREGESKATQQLGQ